ncbi:MAG: hypothetical protein AAFV29_09180, partial [Myxococcota bacterium]
RGLLGRKAQIQLRGQHVLSVAMLRESARRPTPVRGLLNRLPDLLGYTRGIGYGVPHGPQIEGDTLARVAEQLFGGRYAVIAGAPAIRRHLGRVEPDAQRMPPAFVSLLHDHGERLFVFDRFDADILHVRSPHGRSTKHSGDMRDLPQREVVDPDRGIDRVSTDVFQESAGIAVIPVR